MSIKNGNQSLKDMFSNYFYRIPDYQRGYAWEKEQLEDFWEDLINSNEHNHYTGVLSLVGDDGEAFGILSRTEALKLASSRGLDLVLIAPDAKPPVAKVMDFGKFRYQQEKKQKEAKKKQKVIDIKEIKLSIKIAQNDINYKVKHALEFLEQGKFVKFRVFLKGREMQNPEAGVALLERIYQSIEDKASRDKEPNFEGRYVNMLVVPKRA